MLCQCVWWGAAQAFKAVNKCTRAMSVCGSTRNTCYVSVRLYEEHVLCQCAALRGTRAMSVCGSTRNTCYVSLRLYEEPPCSPSISPSPDGRRPLLFIVCKRLLKRSLITPHKWSHFSSRKVILYSFRV